MANIYDYLKRGAAIYQESFAIIRAETNLERFPSDIEKVVVRMVHAAGDPAIADDIDFSEDVVANARAALNAGAPILCDSNMVANGIIRARLPKDNEVVCYLSDPDTSELAAAKGITKTMAAVERWRERLDGAVIAIGNAPTALFRLLEILAETDLRPAAVIGIPVGFVGAAEAKQALASNKIGLEYLTQLGRRGGSPVTVAAINAIASEAE